MRVLFFTRGWPTADNPMSGNYEAVQAKALAKKGIDVTVLNIEWKSLLHIFQLKKKCFDEDGVHVYQVDGLIPIIPHLFNSQKLQSLWKRRTVIKFYKEYLQDHSTFDLIHSHSLFVFPKILPLVEEFHIPLVITEHWSKINEKQDTSLSDKKFAENYLLADQVICVSRKLAESLKKKWNIDSIVINNMVEDQFFATVESREAHSQFQFISVGSLCKRKGFDVLIRAFARIKDQTNLRLEIIGEGEEHEHLQELICSLGLADRIHLAGLCTSAEVGRALEKADAYVLSSWTETFGIVLIEAMAKGLPVVATDCGGPDDIVDSDNGILVSPGDEEALADAMAYIKEHIKDYNKERIIRSCKERFSQDVIADKIISVYKDVLDKKHSI